MIVSYYITALTTFDAKFPKIDFEQKGVIAQMFCTSKSDAKFFISDPKNPFDDFKMPGLRPGDKSLRLKEVFYAIAVAADGQIRSVSFRHQFNRPVWLAWDNYVFAQKGEDLFRLERLDTIADDLRPLRIDPKQRMTQFVA